jgi:uncharacterized protein with GYD domain
MQAQKLNVWNWRWVAGEIMLATADQLIRYGFTDSFNITAIPKLSEPAKNLIKQMKRRSRMKTYLTIIHYTQQGIENIKDTPVRLDTARELYKSMGAEIKSFYLSMGTFDVVLISEAPDDETATKLALTIISAGPIRAETTRLFTEGEYRTLMAELP